MFAVKTLLSSQVETGLLVSMTVVTVTHEQDPKICSVSRRQKAIQKQCFPAAPSTCHELVLSKNRSVFLFFLPHLHTSIHVNGLVECRNLILFLKKNA